MWKTQNALVAMHELLFHKKRVSKVRTQFKHE